MKKILFLSLLLFLSSTAAWAVDVTVSWTHSTSTGVDGYRIYWGTASGEYTSTQDVGYVTSAVIGGFSYDVRYYFAAKAIDGTLESEFSNEATILKTSPPSEQNPPTVTISSPANGATVARKSQVSIIGSATDDVGVVHVDVLVNGNIICGLSTPNFTCVWTVPNAPNKPYTIQAQAFDAVGNKGVSTPVQVTSR